VGSYLIDVTVAEVSMLYVAYADSEKEARMKWEEGDVVHADGPYEMPLSELRVDTISDRSNIQVEGDEHVAGSE
jgi:hypothetical protein